MMESSSYWLFFFAAAVAINISPGPDMVYIISRTVAQGRKAGIASMLGLSSGALVYVFATALGLSALLSTSLIAFNILKYTGAAYLIYLGIKSLRSKGATFDISAQKNAISTPWKAFRQGVLVDILNPKVAIFFMAFLPQFVRPELGRTSAQLITLGILVILTAIVIEFSIVLTAAQTTKFVRKNRRFSVWLDRVLGSVLIGLGLRLALAE